MPSAVGPLSFSTCLACAAITSNASSQRHRRELAVLGVVAVLLAQQRLRQPVGAVHDLGEEIALDAVQAAVDLGQHVAVGGDHLAFLDADHHAAAGSAEAAGAFDHLISSASMPPATGCATAGTADIGRGSGHGRRMRLQHVAARKGHAILQGPRDFRSARTPCWPTARLRSMRFQPISHRGHRCSVLRAR